MTKLIVGLGNPGSEYQFTRHNFGFLALDFYCKTHQLRWEPHPKYQSIYLKTSQAFFIKPQTFYNQVGIAVAQFSHFYKIPPSEILVVGDDFDLDFGKLRLRLHGSAGGNNGLKSVIAHLGTQAFPRLKLGTNQPHLRQQYGDTRFVLSRFSKDLQAELAIILAQANNYIERFLANTL